LALLPIEELDEPPRQRQQSLRGPVTDQRVVDGGALLSFAAAQDLHGLGEVFVLAAFWQVAGANLVGDRRQPGDPVFDRARARQRRLLHVAADGVDLITAAYDV